MNLTNLFNFNFLIQNLKKSKATLALFIGLIPILNILIFILSALNGNSFVPTLENISIMNFIGIYILPIIVSACLFGFVFKKKSVDFVASMPISKKSIFITNFIGGVLILTLMNLVTVISFSFISLIFDNIFISYKILIDYLILWSITYLFVFSATNIAMSVSANVVTQVAMTALILFFIPFTYDYFKVDAFNIKNYYNYHDDAIVCTSDECRPTNYYCYEDDNCVIDKSLGIYETDITKVNNLVYTYPYEFIRRSLFINDNALNLYNGKAIFRMFALSIVYFFLGLKLFERKKLEISATSFASEKVHLLVKNLTIVPMVLLTLTIINELDNLIEIIFIFVIIFIYYLIFDLVTRKALIKLRKNIVAFIIGVLVITIFGLVFGEVSYEKGNTINFNDIKAVAITDLGNNLINDDLSNVYVENKNLISLLIKNYLDNSQNDKDCHYVDAKIKLKNGKVYILNSIQLLDKDYDSLLSILNNDKNYLKKFKELLVNDIYAVNIGGEIYHKNEAQKFLDIIGKAISKSDIINYNKLAYDYHPIMIYAYNHHKTITYKININVDSKLHEEIVNNYNLILEKKINSFSTSNSNLSFDLAQGKDVDTYYLLNYANSKVLEFILANIDKRVDISKDYFTLEVYIDSNIYHFTTNNVLGLNELLKTVREEVKDSEEYKNYINSLNNSFTGSDIQYAY